MPFVTFWSTILLETYSSLKALFEKLASYFKSYFCVTFLRYET